MSKVKISPKPKGSDKFNAKASAQKKRNDKDKAKLKHSVKINTKPKTSEDTLVGLSERFPSLGQQISSSPKIHYKGDKAENWLRLSPTWKTRLAMTGMAFAQGMIFATLALAVLYLPDYLFDYGHREEHFLVFFAKFLVLAVLFIALAAGISSFIRETVVYIDLQRGRILAARRLNAKTIQESAIAFRDISRLNLRASEGKLRRSRLFLEFKTREPMLIAESRGRDEDLIALRDWLSHFVKRD